MKLHLENENFFLSEGLIELTQQEKIETDGGNREDAKRKNLFDVFYKFVFGGSGGGPVGGLASSI